MCSSLPDLLLPTMSERVGLDLSPVDPFSDDAALLAARVPMAGQPGPVRSPAWRTVERPRLCDNPPRLEQGDMVTDLPAVAASIAGTTPLVVFHSWVAAYLDEDQQRTLAKPRSAPSAPSGLFTTSIARRRSRRRASPLRLHPCRARGPTSPPPSCTSARRVSRNGWPTPTRTVTGSAGGRLLVRAPWSVPPGRHLYPLLGDAAG